MKLLPVEKLEENKVMPISKLKTTMVATFKQP